MTAPLDARALEASLRPHGESVMLPREAYTDPAVLAWERRHFFAGTWTCLGRVDELSDGTTYREVTVGDIATIVTFGERPRAFANTCRHRGHELLQRDETSQRPAVVCPYHGWSYELDGSVKAAPRMGDGFHTKPYGLVELPAEVWQGWLFVNATGTATSFTDHVGGLTELVAPYAPESLVLKARHTYDVASNWKTIVENYHECYHCPLIHPELCKVSPPTSGDNWNLPGAWVGGLMDLRPDAETMSLDGRSHGVPLDGVDPRRVNYLGLFPNLLISLHPDYVMTHRMEPRTPGLTAIECSWYFRPEVKDPSYAVEFWDITNREDWAACESVQRGAESPHFRPGPLAPAEDAVYQWVTMLARGYLGKALSSPA
ncbi:aromatic ring-hydroxylating dioxygenase subunit alpha [Kribbella sp. NPDC000426]|uniref:aromatic ring-hydroxylating oxygenase subunit alpha n=1 Tax=Kribbella sp. NPDC000426 TaxID=3154255 RepID=UPI00332ABEB0